MLHGLNGNFYCYMLTLLLLDFFGLEFNLGLLFTVVVWSVTFTEDPLCSPGVLDLENMLQPNGSLSSEITNNLEGWVVLASLK